MIISKAPFRVSFFGGGTDFQPYFEENGGAVLSTTIDKYCYAFIRQLPPFFEYHTQVKYAVTESVRKTEEIAHPLIRNCMIHTDMHNLSILYDADLPARSGIGSSSSFAAALLQGLYALKGQYISKEQLAKEAIYVEREMCAETGGWQDQIAAVFGGLNRIDFSASRFSVSPIIISNERKKQLEESLLMFFTGISRNSFEVAKEQFAAVNSKKVDLAEMKRLVDEAEILLTSKENINEFGRMLDYAWKLKRGVSGKISSDYIDELYQRGISAGAIGGKLLGAGGGGFMLFFAPKERHTTIREAFKGYVEVPIKFENEGTKIVHYTSEVGNYGRIVG